MGTRVVPLTAASLAEAIDDPDLVKWPREMAAWWGGAAYGFSRMGKEVDALRAATEAAHYARLAIEAEL